MLRRDILEQQIDNLLITYPALADDEDFRRDMLEGSTDFFEYLEFLAKRVGACKAGLIGTKAWRDEILERIDRLQQREAFYRELIMGLMEKANMPKVELNVANLRVQAGNRKVIITDEMLLPDACVNVVRYPNKSDISVKLKAGEIVPGAELANSPPHLVVSFK